jgi:hypothetical protein
MRAMACQIPVDALRGMRYEDTVWGIVWLVKEKWRRWIYQHVSQWTWEKGRCA